MKSVAAVVRGPRRRDQGCYPVGVEFRPWTNGASNRPIDLCNRAQFFRPWRGLSSFINFKKSKNYPLRNHGKLVKTRLAQELLDIRRRAGPQADPRGRYTIIIVCPITYPVFSERHFLRRESQRSFSVLDRRPVLRISPVPSPLRGTRTPSLTLLATESIPGRLAASMASQRTLEMSQQRLFQCQSATFITFV